MLADEIAHDLMKPGTSCYDRLKQCFTEEDIYLPDGNFDKGKMAQVIFSNQEKREQLNAIVHPAVKEYVIQTAKQEREKGELDLLILEAALLIEEHYDEICEELWYIYTSEENREKRLMESRGYSKEKVHQIFNSQLKEEDYRKVMLPMIVVRRFDCLLDNYNRETIKEVYNTYDFLPEEEKDEIVIADLKENHGMDLQFYNVSDFTWKKLLDDSENIKSNKAEQEKINKLTEDYKKEGNSVFTNLDEYGFNSSNEEYIKAIENQVKANVDGANSLKTASQIASAALLELNKNIQNSEKKDKIQQVAERLFEKDYTGWQEIDKGKLTSNWLGIGTPDQKEVWQEYQNTALKNLEDVQVTNYRADGGVDYTYTKYDEQGQPQKEKGSASAETISAWTANEKASNNILAASNLWLSAFQKLDIENDKQADAISSSLSEQASMALSIESKTGINSLIIFSLANNPIVSFSC